MDIVVWFGSSSLILFLYLCSQHIIYLERQINGGTCVKPLGPEYVRDLKPENKIWGLHASRKILLSHRWAGQALFDRSWEPTFSGIQSNCYLIFSELLLTSTILEGDWNYIFPIRQKQISLSACFLSSFHVLLVQPRCWIKGPHLQIWLSGKLKTYQTESVSHHSNSPKIPVDNHSPEIPIYKWRSQEWTFLFKSISPSIKI